METEECQDVEGLAWLGHCLTLCSLGPSEMAHLVLVLSKDVK